MKLDKNDQATLRKRGITPEKLEQELHMIREGFPPLRVEAAATIGNGIVAPTPEIEATTTNLWNEFIASGGRVMKMVPASGAASRMFKDLFAFVDGKADKPSNDFMKRFFDNIEDFAFFNILNHTCMRLYGKSIDTLKQESRYKDIVSALIGDEGMRYGKLPKALLRFHRTMGTTLTSLEEHLAEGAEYALGKDGKVRIHFTVSSEHMPLVEARLEEVVAPLRHKLGSEFEITMSVQKPSTDTIAANMDGTPYRENGELFFRPGGHGALIENLGDLDADVVFIKNIDNVVPARLREATVRYKKMLGGMLVGVKHKLDAYCRMLSQGLPTEQQEKEMVDFMHSVLCISHDELEGKSREDVAAFLLRKFNRPVRVCGVVKNEGEPGGGPFLAYNPDGTVSPQIMEASQFADDKESRKLLKEATHFNPVDLVCAIRDFEGKRFPLKDYIDPATGFISIKSREGVEIKALELPGLWNGAMSDWNTIFVEVPVATFNPVKTVNDLLRQAHQA